MKILLGILILLLADNGIADTYYDYDGLEDVWSYPPHEHEESYWVTLGGRTSYSFMRWNTPPRSSYDLDRRVEIELPAEMCWDAMTPWLREMRDYWYRESCPWDFDGDRGIGIDDLGLAISEVTGRLGETCDPIQ